MKKWKKSIAAMLAAIVFVGGMPADKVHAEDATEVMENAEDTESTEAEAEEAEGVVEDTESVAEENTEESTKVVVSENEDEATTEAVDNAGTIDENDEDVSLNDVAPNIVQGKDHPDYTYAYFAEDKEDKSPAGYYIVGYLGNDSVINIPETIDGHTIVGFAGFTEPAGEGLTNNQNIKQINLPKTLTVVPCRNEIPFDGCANLESITVAKGNPVLWDSDGVLYGLDTKKSKVLMVYPEGKKNSSFSIPYDIKGIFHIANIKYLKKLVIPNTVNYTISKAFPSFTGTLYINEINVSRGILESITSASLNGIGSDAKIVVKTNDAEKCIKEKCGKNCPPIEVNPNAHPATSFTFSDGTTEKDVVVDLEEDGSTFRDYNKCLKTYFSELQTLKMSPENATDNIVWKCNDPDDISGTISMSDGTIALSGKTGSSVYTGSDESGHNVTINLTVYQKVTSAELTDDDCIVKFDKNNPYVKVGYRVSPLNANNRSNEITWTSSNHSVATVTANGGDEYNNYYSNFGTITLKSTGTTTITASINDKVNGKDNIISKSFTLTVKDPPVDINTLNISDIPDATYTGKVINPAVTIKDGAKTLRKDVDYTVSPSDNNAGWNFIRITGIGDYTGEITKEFVIKPYNLKKASVKLGDKDENGCYSKDDIVVTANGRELTVGKDYKVSLSSVSKDGYADIIVKGTNNYCGTYTIKKVKVSTGKANLSNATISGVKNVTYTGKAITFPVTIKLDGKVLDQNTDCTITYKNNKYAGTATIIVKAKSGSEYEGSCSKTFKIARKAQKIKNVKSSYTKKYGDKSFKIKPSVSDKAKVSYKSSNAKVVTVSKKGVIKPVNTGVAYVTVSTKATSGYSAAKKQIKITVKPKTQTVRSLKSSKKAEMTVTWKKDTKATGYQIQYSTNSKMKSAKTVRIKKNTTYKQTIKKLKKGKKYYVRVRSYKTVKVNGKSVTVYGSWSKVKSVKVN